MMGEYRFTDSDGETYAVESDGEIVTIWHDQTYGSGQVLDFHVADAGKLAALIRKAAAK